MVSNWWYRRGGLGTVMLDEVAALEERGHVVLPFASAHPANLPASTSRYFPRFLETAEAGRGLPIGRRAQAARDLIVNRNAVRRFEALVDDHGPDLVHVHNTVRQLSPAILGGAARRNLPVLLTLHDYGLICPQGLLLRGGTDICNPPRCAVGMTLPAVRHRCVKGSVAASAAAAVEIAVHRRSGAYSRRIDALIAPSEFIAGILAGPGRWPGLIYHLPNGIPLTTAPLPPPSSRKSIVFAGRLVAEKGVDVLIEAARRCPEIDVVIAGDGPAAARLRELAPSSVSFVGHQPRASVDDLIGDARAIVVPSVWLENAPLSILEGMRAGRPVITTDLGGSQEALADGGGIVVPAGNAEQLSIAMRRLFADPLLADSLGAAGRLAFERRFTLDRHVDGLEHIYRETLASRRAGSSAGGMSPRVSM